MDGERLTSGEPVALQQDIITLTWMILRPVQYNELSYQSTWLQFEMQVGEIVLI